MLGETADWIRNRREQIMDVAVVGWITSGLVLLVCGLIELINSQLVYFEPEIWGLLLIYGVFGITMDMLGKNPSLQVEAKVEAEE